MAKKTERKTRMTALLGLSIVVVVGLIVVYVPVQENKTILNLIMESNDFNEPRPEICIDGIYFGVCGGEPIFDEGRECFGLTTQQCFDKCNVIGSTCRMGNG